MKIVHVATEIAPIAKVGGLGDVLQGLGHALVQEQQQVTLLLPKYRSLDLSPIESLKQDPNDPSLWEGTLFGATLLLLDLPEFFDRDSIYGEPDDIERFTAFCQKAAKVLEHLSPALVHLHDWPTALLTTLVPFPTLFTIHNLAHQGITSPDRLAKLGLSEDSLRPFRSNQELNLMQGAIALADRVTTVSPTYAEEIKETPLIAPYKDKFSGILNGIDQEAWNPNTDPLLPHHFETYQGKKPLKRILQQTLSLTSSDAPLVAAICRLVPQKSPDLLIHALEATLEMGGQFVLLGSAPDRKTHLEFEVLQKRYHPTRQVHLELTYNEELSHRLYGAADLFLVPSRFEPCGLTQLIALRYGALPLVRETGGLKDTVFDLDHSPTRGNGFSFGPPTKSALQETLQRAFALWDSSPKIWQELANQVMQQDYGWNASSKKYMNLYQSLSHSNKF